MLDLRSRDSVLSELGLFHLLSHERVLDLTVTEKDLLLPLDTFAQVVGGAMDGTHPALFFFRGGEKSPTTLGK